MVCRLGRKDCGDPRIVVMGAERDCMKERKSLLPTDKTRYLDIWYGESTC